MLPVITMLEEDEIKIENLQYYERSSEAEDQVVTEISSVNNLNILIPLVLFYETIF